MWAALNGQWGGEVAETWPHGPCPGFGDRATVQTCRVSLDPWGPLGRFQGPDGNRKFPGGGGSGVEPREREWAARSGGPPGGSSGMEGEPGNGRAEGCRVTGLRAAADG